jgi:hypothetical protein
MAHGQYRPVLKSFGISCSHDFANAVFGLPAPGGFTPPAFQHSALAVFSFRLRADRRRLMQRKNKHD